MKRILSLLCALLLLCGSLPALADDFLLGQTAEMLKLTREKATLTALYTASPDLTAAAERIAAAIAGEAITISILQFDNAGAFVRFAQQSGEELPGLSAELAAVLDASVPAALITQLQSTLGAQEVATASMLTMDNAIVPRSITHSALVVVDFGTAYQLACTYTLSPDGAVTCAARPVSAELNVLDFFCAFYETTQEQLQIVQGSAFNAQ